MPVADSAIPMTRPVLRRDYDRVAAFMTGFRGQNRDRAFWLERFAFWWEDNPFFAEPMTRGWMLEVAGETVGFLGCIRLPCQWNHAPCASMTPTAWNVLPEYGQHALRLFVEQLDEADGALLWDTTPTGKVRELSLRLGFTPIVYPCDHDCLLFKDHASRLEWHLRARGRDSWWPARFRRLERLLEPLRSGPRREEDGYAAVIIREPGQVDERFDRLWEQTRQLKSHTRIRSAAWVRWYCFGFPSQPKRLFGCFLDGNLTGFVIFREISRTHPRPGALPARFLECLDLWHDPKHPETIPRLMETALDFTRLRPLLGLSVWNHPPLHPWLAGQNRIVRTAGTPGGLLRIPPALRATAGETPPYFLLAEGDVGL